ncbi:MAG TPA: hypothetical protein VFT22_22265 [Kofleriaceae bacterium]|nr:hypothetical protein [Kofleriaceae bacterium]
MVPQRLAWWRKRLRAARPQTTTALTFIPAAVIGAAIAHPAAVIRLPNGMVIELEGVSPTWVAALARELTRSGRLAGAIPALDAPSSRLAMALALPLGMW